MKTKYYLIEIRYGANRYEIFRKIEKIKLANWDFTTTNFGIFKLYLTKKEYDNYLRLRKLDNFTIFKRSEFLKLMRY